jgi:hypothetical protein
VMRVVLTKPIEREIIDAHAAPPFRHVERSASNVKTAEVAAPGHEG